jgi:hypothetical protein
MSAELSLRKGWNIIGSISAPVHVDAVTADPPGLIWTDYFGYEDGYYIADSIVPGRGYWVKTTVAGTIGLEAGAVATPATAAHRRKSAADRVGRGGLNELVITPAAAPGRQVRSGTLWFGDIADADLPSFDLPPLPPGNGFDARFATHRNGARIGAGAVEETQLLVQGPAGGAELKWNVADAGNGAQAGTAYLVGRVANRVVSRMKMSGSGSTQIVTDGTVRYAVSYEAVPKSVALLQNYPNPFNPATEIGFELPAATEVSLAVYDLTGRLVAQLISGETLEAGSHTTHFDAAQLASGVYYYRLTAPGFTAVKKMALVR